MPESFSIALATCNGSRYLPEFLDSLSIYNQSEAEIFRTRWQDFLYHDPTHNPNMGCDNEPPLLDFPAPH